MTTCKCGHEETIHEFEDDGAASCCMAHIRLFRGTNEGKSCPCQGFVPVSPAQLSPEPAETQAKSSSTKEILDEPAGTEMKEGLYNNGKCHRDPVEMPEGRQAVSKRISKERLNELIEVVDLDGMYDFYESEDYTDVEKALRELVALRAAAEGIEKALKEIIDVANGENQLAQDDTEGIVWIDKFAQAALAAYRKALKK